VISPDVVFVGGTVVTADPSAPRSSALAVAGGRIIALGDTASALVPDAGEVIDLAGRSLLPGFRDGHVHPLWGGMELASLPLAGATSLDELLDRVRAHAVANPDRGWIHGGGYHPSLLPGGDGVADAALLDAVVPDRPVALEANDHHTMWVNSRALELAGIDAHTPDPPLGEIVRRGDGSPMGTLREWGALALVQRLLPRMGLEQRAEGLRLAMTELGRAGIVWAQEAAAAPDEVAAYADLARAGGLTTRVNAALRADPGTWSRRREAFVSCRRAVETDGAVSDRLSARTVKFFADGVIEAGTGFLLEPYDDAPHSCGLPNWSPQELSQAVTAFDADGFQIHIHAIGDGGVRMALDAVAAAALRNGPADRRAVIAHTQLVHPDDRSRFALLGVIANFEPLWACLDPTQVDLTIPRLGPGRSALQYPIATLSGNGTRLSFGSDWPVSSVSPLHGLAVAVTRQTPDGEPAHGWLPEERLPIEQAIAAYSTGTAYQAFEDGHRGALTVGSKADLALLSADVVAMAGSEIADVAIEGTWVDGRATYRA